MLFKKVIIVSACCFLAGCASSNIKSFRVDPSVQHDIKHNDLKSTYLKNISMEGDDHNSIMCRLAGNIYLPKKMTYSQYINDAFQKTLMVLNAHATSRQTASHEMKMTLTEVTFNTIQGEWRINANVYVDESPLIQINSTTEYGTSYDAVSACRNTADSFDEAAANFITEVLNHPKIHSELSK